jgi:hypothetical protein
MTEASGLQAVFDRSLDDFKQHHPLSPDQERACRHIEQANPESGDTIPIFTFFS